MPKNLFIGKSVKRPNKCKKVRGCKVAKGTQRTYCRKIHNKTSKSKRKSGGSVKKTAKKVMKKLTDLVKM